ncbi:hypothetical protein LCGC14_2696280 [marine sediment metagenome]|uniref:Uncharacterized protein n=1 Tax=marine sediment metagenome TaxID=412755 RepID=A0A0F8ZH68_9ZZZZ
MNATDQLCIHDPRNEDGCSCNESEKGSCPGPRFGSGLNSCACDNCFYGRDELAREVLDAHKLIKEAARLLDDAAERLTEIHSPIEVAIALSLYGYNVGPAVRAQRLYDHFEGHCAELIDLREVLVGRVAFAATEFAYPTAKVYVQHALGKYGDEARRHVAANEDLA